MKITALLASLFALSTAFANPLDNPEFNACVKADVIHTFNAVIDIVDKNYPSIYLNSAAEIAAVICAAKLKSEGKPVDPKSITTLSFAQAVVDGAIEVIPEWKELIKRRPSKTEEQAPIEGSGRL